MPSSLDCTSIYAQYNQKVYSYILSHVSNSDDAEDLRSKVFEKILKSQDSYRGNPNAVSSFVYTTTRNLVIDYYRTRKNHEEIPESLESSESVEDIFFTNQILDLLTESLNALKENERTIIALHYYVGLSLNEISKKRKLSYSKIKILHRHALKKIKESFNEKKLV